MEKGITSEMKGFCAEITYQIGEKTETHFFGPFPSHENLAVAIIAYERSLEHSHRYNWKEVTRQSSFSPPSPDAV